MQPNIEDYIHGNLTGRKRRIAERLMQAKLRLRILDFSGGPCHPQTHDEFFRLARWHQLQAHYCTNARGEALSSRRDLWYAENMLLLAKARVVSGEVAPFRPGIDPKAEQCEVCHGPVTGAWGCGGVEIVHTKHDRRKTCSAACPGAVAVGLDALEDEL